MRNKYLISLHDHPYFDISLLKGLFPLVPKRDLYNYLSYWVKTGKIHRIQNGRFVTNEAYLKYMSDNNYREFMASILCYPSYLSTEYVLSKYGLLTEGVYSITSVTLNERKDVSNMLGDYIYKQISPKYFNGYIKKYFIKYEYFEASKAKALFDYLYFRKNMISNEMISGDIVENLRLNLENLNSDDKRELATYINNSKINKLIQIYKKLV